MRLEVASLVMTSAVMTVGLEHFDPGNVISDAMYLS